MEVLKLDLPEQAGNETRMTDEYYDYYEYAYKSLCSEPIVDGKTEEAVNLILQTYIFPIILLIGIIGNLISFRCLHQLSINVWSSCLYLNVLCVVDLLVLFVECGNLWFQIISQHNLGDEIMRTSAAICKIYPFLFQFILHIGPWILVASSVEMMIATHYPLLIYKMCTRERGKAVMLLITVLLTCINMHHFWTYGLVTFPEAPTDAQKQCIYIEEFSEFFRESVWPFLNLAVYRVLPLLVISVLFFITTTAMVRKRHKQMEFDLKKTLEKYFMDIQSLNELKTTFLLISLSYIIVTTLRVILVTVEYLISLGAVEIPCELNYKVFSVLKLIGTLIDIFHFCFLSLKFVIYLMTSARFRRELAHTALNIISICQRRDRINLSKNNLATKPLMDGRNNSLEPINTAATVTDGCIGTSKITTNV